MKKLLSLLICIGLVMSFFAGCSSKTTIYVYNVGDYIDEEVIKLFEKEYPEIKVNYETFYTNEEGMLITPENHYLRPLCYNSRTRPVVNIF